MNIPNLPTDNLYKFLALFGLTIIGLGVIVLVQMRNEPISLLLFECGTIISLSGFALWYFKLQKHLDTIVEKKAKSIKESRAINVNKIQFEKEFEVYEIMWTSLSKLVLISFRGASFSKETPKAKLDSIIIEFIDQWNCCSSDFERYKPFYPKEISVLIQTLLSSHVAYVNTMDSEDWERVIEVMGYVNLQSEKVFDQIQKRIGLVRTSED